MSKELELSEARRLEAEQIQRDLDERKVRALERIAEHLSNIADLLLESRNSR